ncbi:hypothetical protein NEMBOFW57_002916 [Staphylotrichum longicolle]|uniref:Alternative sulfate transporter n=1 Tax=Staphylotrichum longicolle TaxID=669026 RepID=A0AAD4F3Y1_9PEZI|nr:hypothetical protein NEMBOFW57_002916 [Staphylotrichum longicolle]
MADEKNIAGSSGSELGVDEKNIVNLSESQFSRSDDEGQEITWTDEEEKVLVRRIDFIVMPLLILAFFALQIDRGNIGNAMTDFFLQDIGITQFQFNVGQQLLSAGIIPSNMILYRLGPTVWLGSQIVAWGFVAAFQAFQKGLGPFLVTRLLLGLCEAGFIPAGLFTLTRWYKRGETTKRFSIYFLGNLCASACSGLIAYGIEREAQILQQRVLRDDPSKFQPRKNVSWTELKATLTNWRLLPHICTTVLGMAPAHTMGSYAPTLVVSFGFDRLKSNAMLSIGGWILLVTNLVWGFGAEKTKLRGPWVFLGVLILWGLTIGNRVLIDSKNANLRFGVLVTATAFQTQWHAINGAWMSLNARSAGERSITMAIFVMGANLAGIIGSQIFQAKDAPLYRTGWTVIMALMSVALLMSVIANVQYWLLNRFQKRKGEARYHY